MVFGYISMSLAIFTKTNNFVTICILPIALRRDHLAKEKKLLCFLQELTAVDKEIETVNTQKEITSYTD